MSPNERTRLLKVRFEDTDGNSNALCSRRSTIIYLSLFYTSSAVLIYLVCRVYERAFAYLISVLTITVRIRWTSMMAVC
jgi:hypothetical protein